MSKWYVYHIKNPSNSSIELGYVGVTVNVKKRFKDHHKTESHVGNAIRKYKLTFSSVSVISEFDTSKEAYELEAKLRPDWRIGWNITPGGEGYQKDLPQDVYTRAKMSLSKKGKSSKPQSPEHYERLSKEQTGKKRKQSQCPFCYKIGGEGNMQKWHFGKCKKAPKVIKKINGFDCDGVITLGLRPDEDDVIITGRSFEEGPETYEYLKSRNIKNSIYFSYHRFENKTRELSGKHKGETIWNLFQNGIVISVFFEDDWDQLKIIKKIVKNYALPTELVWVNHGGLISLENKRHHENLPNFEELT